ncbi:MAG: FAD-dependent oxidoreductase [Caldilineaceae bacterium]|nr:FAD-dependent oxidoreductase [Caldilineaceae bacterium]
MTAQLGTEQRPLRVAIVGAGPSGFYAAGALLKPSDLHVSVDMIDRLPAPHGLVRYGVAPDHQNIKAVSKVYDRTAADARFRFFGNVQYGEDITYADLKRLYDVVIYAVGAQSDRRLNIPGEDLPNSMSATEFVAWYNGHPDYVDHAPDLEVEAALVVGVGNVAMDVARILAKTADELAETDIADYALPVLAESKIKRIYVVARRGPAQSKFTNVEIREFGHLDNADVIVDPADLRLDKASSASIQDDTAAQKNMDYLNAYAEMGDSGKPRKVYFKFLLSPVEIIAGDDGKIAAVKLEKNRLRPTTTGYINSEGTGEYETLDVGLVLRSVGYKGLPVEGVPYNQRNGTIPNEVGRIVDPETERPRYGEYVVGWAKRGPTGVIGTNKPDAIESVNSMLEDLSSGRIEPAPDADPAAVVELLEARNVRFVTMDEWGKLNELELSNGKAQGRPRVKFTNLDNMLAALEGAG